MANTILTIDDITSEALMILENNLTFTKQVTRKYDDKFGNSGAQIGDTLRIRKPAQYSGRTGTALSPEDFTEDYTTLVLDKQFGVDVTFTTKELTLNINDFSDQVLAPAVARIANEIDKDGLGQYKYVSQFVGVPETVPNALLTYLQAKQKLMEAATPVDANLAVVVNPAMEATIVNALSGLFHSTTEIKRQYEEGTMGRSAGFKWSMDQNVATHTVGALGGTPLTNGSNQTGASLITDGWTAAAANRLKDGDIITIGDVFAVNPQSKQSTGALKQFRVVGDTASDGSGNATITIDPPIIASGAKQNVTNAAADGKAILTFGHASSYASKNTPQALAFHKDAFCLGMADLLVPEGVHFAGRKSSRKLGVSIRIVRQYDINTDKIPCRLDVLYGWKTIRPELATRIVS